MERNENSYRSILKGTSFFGGVQIVQILINLVRGKFVAMFLGPEGIGISSLFNTSSNTIQRLSSLGLNLAIVKEVAAESGNPDRLPHTLSAAKRLTSITALAGALFCVLLSPWLSRITFGDSEMAWQFALLGIAVGLTIGSNGRISILQGMHEVKRISMASIVGGLTGLVVGVPLYYFFGTKGIVPAMIALALSMWLFSYVSVRKSIALPTPPFSWRVHKPLVRKLFALGFLLMANDLILSLVQYLINIYVNSQGSTDTVGLYQAANSITNQYSGMVFTAMAMDYFPRLSKVAADNSRMCEVVNRQTEIVTTIIAPAVALLILTAPVVIRILLTSEFLPTTPLMRWMGLGILLRAMMVPMGYISFAKGNKKLFFWLEGVACNLITLILSCVFFHFFGLAGLGYALVADNALCLMIYYVVNRNLYGYRFSRGAFRGMASTIFFGGAAFASSLIDNEVLAYSLMATTFTAAAIWATLSIRGKLNTRHD